MKPRPPSEGGSPSAKRRDTLRPPTAAGATVEVILILLVLVALRLLVMRFSG